MWLKQQLQSELDVAWVAGGGDPAEGGRAQEVVGEVEVRVIEEVEGLSTKLKIHTLVKSSVLQ